MIGIATSRVSIIVCSIKESFTGMGLSNPSYRFFYSDLMRDSLILLMWLTVVVIIAGPLLV